MIQTQSLLTFFTETRARTEQICRPLEIEDYVVQPIIDVSPPKWHLGHSTWFFEEFILKSYKPNYKLFHPDFAFVFNSYYESMGERVVRSDRGNLSRPGVAKVYDYRHYVTNELKSFLETEISKEIKELVLIGIHHEKQHQELLLTDIKYILGNNPLLPAYDAQFVENPTQKGTHEWISVSGGLKTIGYSGDAFCYDNELGQHQVFVNDYHISNLYVTNNEFISFIEAGGYQNHHYWHADAWEWIAQEKISKPMYWHLIDGEWHQYTLQGLQPLEKEAPLSHISYYEAFAYAQFMDCRLPTEFEWEAAQDHFKWGSRWEWTESAYAPYPNYRKAPGALGEYNGKFMVNQKVLRGGSVATAKQHTRATYRNFFQPQLRWQFTGIRLAK